MEKSIKSFNLYIEEPEIDDLELLRKKFVKNENLEKIELENF